MAAKKGTKPIRVNLPPPPKPPVTKPGRLKGSKAARPPGFVSSVGLDASQVEDRRAIHLLDPRMLLGYATGEGAVLRHRIRSEVRNDTRTALIGMFGAALGSRIASRVVGPIDSVADLAIGGSFLGAPRTIFVRRSPRLRMPSPPRSSSRRDDQAASAPSSDRARQTDAGQLRQQHRGVGRGVGVFRPQRSGAG